MLADLAGLVRVVGQVSALGPAGASLVGEGGRSVGAARGRRRGKVGSRIGSSRGMCCSLAVGVAEGSCLVVSGDEDGSGLEKKMLGRSMIGWEGVGRDWVCPRGGCLASGEGSSRMFRRSRCTLCQGRLGRLDGELRGSLAGQQPGLIRDEGKGDGVEIRQWDGSGDWQAWLPLRPVKRKRRFFLNKMRC